MIINNILRLLPQSGGTPSTILFAASKLTGAATNTTVISNQNTATWVNQTAPLYTKGSAGDSWFFDTNTGFITQYNTNSSGTFTKLYDMTISYSGSNSEYGFIQASNGKLYGATQVGAAYGTGAILEVDIVNFQVTKLLDIGGPFPSTIGNLISNKLFQASDGNLWGVYGNGANGYGFIGKFNIASKTLTNVFDFTVTSGQYPRGAFLEFSNGILIGTTSYGGANNLGTIYQFNINSSIFTKLYDFTTATNGAYPTGGLLKASNSKLYGMAGGGSSSNGVIYEFDANTNTYTKLRDFSSTDGSSPGENLIQGSNGNLYGVTQFGGPSTRGVLFEYNLSTSIYKYYDPGVFLYTAPFEGSDGKLYYLSMSGGTNNLGTLSTYNFLTNTNTILVSFSTSSGTTPKGQLLEASDGFLYGMTREGGGSDAVGSIYSYDISVKNYIHKTTNGATGTIPWSVKLTSRQKLFSLWFDSTKTYGYCGTLNNNAEPGTATAPYLISTPAEFSDMIANQTYNYYALKNDIDFSSFTWTNPGDTSGAFTKNFNGRGYKISNITYTATNELVSVFGFCDTGAVIKNLIIDNFNFTVTINNGGFWSGGIVSAIFQGATADKIEIFNSSFTVNMVSGDMNGGGAFGAVSGSSNITRCSADVDISNGSTAGSSPTGGFAGYIDNSTVTTCYSRGSVSNTAATPIKGGFAGSVSSSTTTNNFYDSTTSGQSDTTGATPEPSASMKTSSTYTGWDFTNDWVIEPSTNNGYPILIMPYQVVNPSVVSLYKSTDAGETWSEIPNSPPISIYQIFSPDNTNFYLTGWDTTNNGRLFYTTDFVTYTDMTPTTISSANPSGSVVVSSGIILLAIGSVIYRYNGSAWTNVTPTIVGATGILFQKIIYVTTTVMYAVGYGTATGGGNASVVCKSTNGGTSWTRINIATNFQCMDIAFTSATNGYIVGSGGTIIATTTGGTSSLDIWQTQTSGTTQDLSTISTTA